MKKITPEISKAWDNFAYNVDTLEGEVNICYPALYLKNRDYINVIIKSMNKAHRKLEKLIKTAEPL